MKNRLSVATVAELMNVSEQFIRIGLQKGIFPFGYGQFDLYDFKYSNNIDHYMESRQLHVYKYFFERITGKHIRKMYFVFVPKVQIRQKKTETLSIYILKKSNSNIKRKVKKMKRKVKNNGKH